MASASRAMFGHILVTMVLVCASSTLLQAQGFRQPQVTMPIEDQPGYEPDTSAEQLPAAYRRQLVFYRTTEAPGTIIVHTSERFLYLVQGNNRAVRYGIGVGRDGFQWSGLLKISRKAEWPDWRPPPEMIERQPYLPRFMAGGPGNPLGARALYLGETIYRIHGTNQPQTIGQSVSSGCFRLVNPDVIDLFDRVPVGTKVVVRQNPEL
jgi:lipoprotein-anchoring transpeptidase ErfK/SrfK